VNAFVFQAAMLCEACAMARKASLEASGVVDDGTSDTFPQGPYGAGGGEADSPQHCDDCGEFLENPLTTDGAEYVAEKVGEMQRGDNVTAAWAKFYDIALPWESD
jgi:hypothetical protein